ncbi:MAG: stage V sporulation protein AE, partial [Planifilum fulgidum]
MKRKVILITDGDRVAREAVEEVARQVGGRAISASAGNPTPLTGEQLVELILQAKHDPVLVMFDDCGSGGTGRGERAMEYVANHPDVEVLGAGAGG